MYITECRITIFINIIFRPISSAYHIVSLFCLYVSAVDINSSIEMINFSKIIYVCFLSAGVYRRVVLFLTFGNPEL